jgi:CBS domain-containing protein
MFSVYGVTGRVFTGSPEQLRHIDKVNALARLRHIEPNELVLFPDPRSDPPDANPPATAGGSLVPTALAAYAHTSQPDTPRQPLDRVAQLMTQPAVTTRADVPLAVAAELLEQRRIGQMPVLDAGGRLVGLLLRADLFRPRLRTADAGQDENWQAQPVSTAMWTPIASVSADTDIRRVAQVLLDTGLPGLPVVDDAGGVVGFVSRTDIVRAVAADPPLDVWG